MELGSSQSTHPKLERSGRFPVAAARLAMGALVLAALSCGSPPQQVESAASHVRSSVTHAPAAGATTSPMAQVLWLRQDLGPVDGEPERGRFDCHVERPSQKPVYRMSCQGSEQVTLSADASAAIANQLARITFRPTLDARSRSSVQAAIVELYSGGDVLRARWDNESGQQEVRTLLDLAFAAGREKGLRLPVDWSPVPAASVCLAGQSLRRCVTLPNSDGYCYAEACTPGLSAGMACTRDVQCASRHCFDSTCLPDENRIDPRIRRKAEEAGPNGSVGVLIHVRQGGFIEKELIALGATGVSRQEELVIATLPVRSLLPVARLPFVLQIGGGEQLRLERRRTR